MAVASGTNNPTPAGLATQAKRRVPFAKRVTGRRAAQYPIAISGAVVVVAGFAAQLVAIVALTWWQGTVHGRTVSMQFADFGPQAWRGFAYIYFSWGAWLIAGLTLGLGIAGCVRWSGAHAFRVCGALIAVVAAFAPIAALLVFAYQSDSDLFHVLRDYSIGPYLAVLGTMATAFGVAAGSARSRVR